MNIIVVSPSLQGVRGAATNEEGFFWVLALPTGYYSVKVTHLSYQEASFQQVVIRLGKTTTLGEIYLKPQTLEMPEIVISGEKPLIDPTSTEIGDNLI